MKKEQEKIQNLKSQFATSSWGGRRKLPFAFTEHGVVMLSSVAELSKMLMLHIENTDKRLNEHDEAINQIIRALNNLIEQPPKTKKIGFGVSEKTPKYLDSGKM